MNLPDPAAEIEELRRRLEEAEATLSAIRNGEVDALVVTGEPAPKIYTLQGADHPYRVLVEAMQQGAVTLSSDGAIAYCNTAFAEMVAQSCEKIVGCHVQDYFAPAERATVLRLLARAHTTPGQAEFALQVENGAQRPVLVSISALPLESGQALWLVITDLTEHHQNRDLKDSDRRKDEFLAMLAHELRNPLAPISNAAQMLMLSNQAGDDVHWACDIIERQVRQMTRIVDDLLDVSRITRGKINLKLVPIELAAVIASAVETSRPLIESRRHTLDIVLSDEPLLVNADVTRLAQVFTNLLNNAAKYTEEGGRISLVARRAGPEAVVSVQDTGIGMPPEMLPKVFDLFTQVDHNIDRSQGGLGIGLTLVHRLVEMHRGSVSASSAGPGLGSEFVVRMPLLPARPEPSSVRTLATNGKTSPAHRVLVVDDNIDSAQTLAQLMTMAGHKTQVAHSGPAALEAAQDFRPTLVLLDIGLPGMDGYEVARTLRTLPAVQGAVLVAVTGYGDERDRRRSQEAGFDHHLVKPVLYDALQDLLA